MQARTMGLRQRGGGHRGFIKESEYLRGRRAKVGLELLADVRVRQRRHCVLQFGELGDPFRRQQVDTGRQHLAELDEGRAKILHRAAHAHRRRHPQQFLPLLVPVQQAPCPFKRGGQADAPHHVAEAITDQDNGNFLQSAQVTDCAQRFPHHACSGRLPEQHVTAGRRHRATPPLRSARA
ncbi:hypothetical protein G6F57_018785 [Rhizopus arrhizus]|nr:hypothetical protein G6F57_018785 [Rhizopus arrhizus]